MVYFSLFFLLCSGKPSWNIHFWLGNKSSDDEKGVAAYKTVELDDSLGGGPVQYREVQGSESALFQSYFKTTGGIHYLPGGVASGFKHVERDVYETRLLHCKGARTVRVQQVPLAKSSLNKGDVFILDAGLLIYIFNGPKANRQEKAKGVEVATRLRDDERGGRAQIIFVENDNAKIDGFWGPLGGYENPILLPEGADDSTVVEVKIPSKLFVLGHSGSLTLVAEEKKNLSKDQLQSGKVFLLHSSTGKVFLWIGKSTNLEVKRQATANAVKYLKSAGLPNGTQIERVSEGVESNGFKGEFAKWEVPFIPKRTTALTQADQDIDVQALLALKANEDRPVDDGEGKKEVWVVKGNQLVDVPAGKYGQFYGGDSYVIKYTYKKNDIEQYIIYFWLGLLSPPLEQGTAALFTKKKDDDVGGKAVQVRVVQGKEPLHFTTLFKGNLVIHKGGNASTSVYGKPKDNYVSDGVALFRVHGTNELNTKAIEVNKTAADLNSEDCFLLVNPKTVFLWTGRTSLPTERDSAEKISQSLIKEYNGTGGRELVTVAEGSEPATFWELLGGKTAYPESAPGSAPPREARLFELSDSAGSFKVNEVAQFTQADLNNEDIYLLDTYTTVYLWIGTGSNPHEREKAGEFSKQYVKDAADGRDKDSPIITIKAGSEPALFTSHFVPWDIAYFESLNFADPYAARVQAMEATKASTPRGPVFSVKLQPTPKKEGAAPTEAPAAAAPAAASAATATGYFPFDQVKAGTVPGMDTGNKEIYLNDEDFLKYLGSDRATFAAMPKWKRDQKKNAIGLF